MFKEDGLSHPDVMVSSTYADLAVHREAVCDALLRLGFFPVGMEYDSAKSGQDVIASSLSMVAKAHAYIGILSHRYGAIPQDLNRNPDELSITEIEYREALKRGIPVFMFLMSDDHPVKRQDVEPVERYQAKLARLKTDVRSRSISPEFTSVEELRSGVLQSIAELRTELILKTTLAEKQSQERSVSWEPTRPQLLAMPTFIYGHEFVGRQEELRWLNGWATSGNPLLVVEAIGGTGKSTLAWKWLNEQATVARSDFRGRFWYSFYEGGADMRAFAAAALAYVRRQPLTRFRGKRTMELADMLVAALRKEPFLFVLDGLERVLVAYHRLDAAQARDDEVASEKDDRACIKPSDGDLLRQLVACAPSKILITSRLLPTALLNKSGQLLVGASHYFLGGLHPNDALVMMRNVGVSGDDAAITRYLTENFDNHPQIVGIVAGLVKDYVRAPGNFDRWADDPSAGAALHLSKLDLSQRQTHILAAALNGLELGVRKVLSRIAAIGSAIPFETVEALNPYLPPPPAKPPSYARSEELEKYREAMEAYGESLEVKQALPSLIAALQDLEQCGLLQWDRQKNTYDLHPVVRGYAFDVLEQPERVDICERIADHFRNKPRDRYSETKAIADVQQSMNIFRALVQASRLNEALRFYRGDFANALSYSIEAFHEIVALLKPFFPNGFAYPPSGSLGTSEQSYLLNNAAVALIELGRFPEARAALIAKLVINLNNRDWRNLRVCLTNLGETFRDENRLAESHRAFELALELARAIRVDDDIARAQWYLMTTFRITGQFKNAQAAYDAFRQLPAPKEREIYRVGEAEEELCWLRFYQGTLTDQQLNDTEVVARASNNRNTLRSIIRLRGELALQRGASALAINAFESAIEMAHAVGLTVSNFEARLALAKAVAGEEELARNSCDRLDQLDKPPHVELAPAWLQLGDLDRARYHAVLGFTEAWADGIPYSRWWELKQCRIVLRSLGEPEPKLPGFDPSTINPLPHEADVLRAINQLQNNKWDKWG